MSINITMPALSPTMEEGKLAKWHVKEGDNVVPGDVIAEIETDKATMEVEAVDEGKIGKIVVPEGTDNVKVNAVIAVLLRGRGAKARPASASAPPQRRKAQSRRRRRQACGEAGLAPIVQARASAQNPQAPQRSRCRTPPQARHSRRSATAGQTNGHAPRLCLAARAPARQGSRHRCRRASRAPGRMAAWSKRDVEAAKSGKAPLKAPAAAARRRAHRVAALAPACRMQQVMALFPEGSYEIVPNDGMRKVVAQRLTEVKQTVPHFYLTLDCKIDALMAAREKINAAAPMQGRQADLQAFGQRLRHQGAGARRCMKVPTANATWAEDSILYHKHSDVGVAVAVPGGLFTPVVARPSSKSLRQISEGVKDLAGPRPRARS